MNEITQTIPRSLDEPARILGVTPVELTVCAVFYAVTSMILQGVPFGALLSLAVAAAAGATVFILNRSYPPHHGAHYVLALFRPAVTPVLAKEEGLQ